VIMNSELVIYVGNTSYGIAGHVQRKSTGNLIRYSAFMIAI
jgi:hypothetical protein